MGQSLTYRSSLSSGSTFLEEKTLQEFDEFVKDMNKTMSLESEEYANTALETLDSLVWRNPETPEVQEVAEVVEDFVSLVVDKLKVFDDRMRFSLVRSGSYYEGLRVGLPYEFDYMLELEPIQLSMVTVAVPTTLSSEYLLYSNDEVFKANKVTIEGTTSYPYVSDKGEEEGKQYGFYATNRCHVSGTREDMDKKGQNVDSFALRIHVYDALQKIVSQFHKRSYKGVTIVESTFIKDVKPNFCVKMMYKDVGIMVDLVPCVKFLSTFSHILPQIPANVQKFLSDFIPQARANIQDYVAGALYFVSTQYGWRLSFSRVEQAILQQFPCESKRALRILKYISCTFFPVDENSDIENLNKFGYNSVIKSYSLKCVFLSCMIQVYDAPKPKFYSSSYWTFMLLLHSFSFYTRGSLSSLVFKTKHVFSDGFKANFTVLDKSRCFRVLQMVGELLKQCMGDNDWGRFRLLNYPNIHNVNLAPSYFNR